ncbi:MAG: tetratricopeptide repeat protein [Nitrospira sp.]|nr:tetratricopeptide repeat protein [Nitrospira sp.]
MKKVSFILIAFIELFLFSAVSIAGMKEVNKAKEFMKARMFPQAIAILEKEIKNNPTNAEAHFQLGICYALQSDYSGADDRFASAVSINPDKYGYIVSEEYVKAGNLFLGVGQLDRADNAFNKALQYNPKLISTIGEEYKNAGSAYLNIGQIEEADRLFSRALQCKPALGEKIAEEYLKAGQNYLAWQPETAEKVFSATVAFNSALSEKICDIYFEKGKAGANEVDFGFLEKAKKYCNRHDKEIAMIMVERLPEKVRLINLKPNEILDIASVKKAQEWRYLFFSNVFSHRVDIGDNSNSWNVVDNNLPWYAQAAGMLQIKASDEAVTIIIYIP